MALLNPVNFTSESGNEYQPAISPDGNRIANAWNGPNEDNFDIYVKPVGGGREERLTFDPADDFSPAWSSDGNRIAWVRFDEKTKKGGIFVGSALHGGDERLLVAQKRRARPERQGRFVSLAWSPDGKYLAFPYADGNQPDGIYLYSLDTE